MLNSTFALRRSYGFVVLATGLTVVAADLLFYRHPLGWTVAIFTAVFLALLAARSAAFLNTFGGRLIALATLGLLPALIEQPTVLNITYALLCVMSLALINAFGFPRTFPAWLRRFTTLITRGPARLVSDNAIVIRFLSRHGIAPNIARSAVAWLGALMLTGIFIGIFAWANPIISNWMSVLADWLNRFIQWLADLINPLRLLFWLTFAIFAWMLLRARSHRRRRAKPAAQCDTSLQPVPQSYELPSSVPASFVIRCLLLFNLVFAVENVLDARYLWTEKGLPPGMTYKEYVHRGAYPLIAAAMLAGAFVLLTFRPQTSTERSKPARWLVYAWIGQTVLLTLSAGWRLERYVEMSELTRWRIASAVWFLLIAAGLTYVIVRIVQSRTNEWLVNLNVITAAVALYLCCFINFDGMIARFNAMHCREAGGSGAVLDIDYFRTLGPASLPALVTVVDRLPVEWRRNRLHEIEFSLRHELQEDLSDWRGWTFRRARVQRALEPPLMLATTTPPAEIKTR